MAQMRSAAARNVSSLFAKQKRTKRISGGASQKTETGMAATPAFSISHLQNSTSGKSLIAL